MPAGNGAATQDQAALQVEKAAEEMRKAKADADAAVTAARKAEREEEEASSPAAVARRAAIAEKDAVAARREQVSALIPDFSKVTRGELELSKGGEPTAGTAVAGKALHQAADLIKNEVIDRLGADDWCVLVTGDTELATSDAAYWDVDSGLDRLTDLADQVLEATAPAGSEAAGDGGGEAVGPAAVGPAAVGAVVGAVAQAVPGILSLLAAHRTVTTGKVDIDDLAASAAIAGAIKGGNRKRKVFHDGIRLLQGRESVVQKRVEALHDRRKALMERKIALETRKPTDEGTEAPDGLVESIALVASVSASIDEFLKNLTSAPEGATRSSLTAAVLREGLHNETFTHVLLVKAQSASGMQVVNDKLIKDDMFAVVAAASISWVLIAVPEGDVLDAGVTTGTAQVNGKIGDAVTFEGNPSWD